MYTKCPGCGRTLRDTGSDGYCPDCGEPIKSKINAIYSSVDEDESPLAVALSEGPMGFMEKLASFGCLVSLITFLIVMVLCVAALVVGIPEVVANVGNEVGYLFLITPVPVALVGFSGPANIAYYLFLVSAIIASFAYPLYTEGRQMTALLKESLTGLEAPGRDNRLSIFMTAQVFMAIMLIDIVYAIIVWASGVSPETPDFAAYKRWELLYMLARASVWEEIAARTFLIGGGALLIRVISLGVRGRLSRRMDDPPKALKGASKYLLGGWDVFDIPTVGLIAFSAMMFGFAHVSGWDVWKVVPTALSGLGFGFLFVRKGLHAAIMLHFAFDYLSLGFGLLPQTTTVLSIMLMFMVLWAIAGLVYLVFYAKKAIVWFARKEEGPKDEDEDEVVEVKVVEKKKDKEEEEEARDGEEEVEEKEEKEDETKEEEDKKEEEKEAP